MASFFEELWKSVFEEGANSTLIAATNASFGCLQLLLLVLLIATYNIHFLVLSLISAGLWASINWFVKELGAVQDTKGKKMEPETTGASDTETETAPTSQSKSDDALKKRNKGDGSGSGYLSTDSEWERVSEGSGR